MKFKGANTKRTMVEERLDVLGRLYCPPVTITRLRKLFLLALGINMGVGFICWVRPSLILAKDKVFSGIELLSHSRMAPVLVIFVIVAYFPAWWLFLMFIMQILTVIHNLFKWLFCDHVYEQEKEKRKLVNKWKMILDELNEQSLIESNIKNSERLIYRKSVGDETVLRFLDNNKNVVELEIPTAAYQNDIIDFSYVDRKVDLLERSTKEFMEKRWNGRFWQ
jgi:hypothetical protein